MINYFNFKRIDDKYLITNDFGHYMFLSPDDFEDFVTEGQVQDPYQSEELYKKKFVYNSSSKSFVDDNAYLMKEAKDYLFHPTQLHIFVVTNSCNLQCIYCQAQNGSNKSNGFMTKETAKRAVEIAMQSPANYLQFEFQGGEPLLNFEIVKFIVEYSQSICNGKKVEYSIVSNLTLLTDEILEYLKDNNISISTSLDGDKILHDHNRPYRNGNGSYEIVCNSIHQIKQEKIHVGALQTTTKRSLDNWEKIIDSYIELGFDNLSLRPLTPLGCANKGWEQVGYTASEFVEFYKNAIDYILEINKHTYFRENILSIFLKKILEGYGSNYMELRSPCGATLGQIAYYYDGNIFTCDEGRMVSEMGDQSFCLGNVYDSNYNRLMDHDVCKVVCTSSVLESLPSCADCVYQPYCGVCPVVNFALDKDLYAKTPNNYRCVINKGILDTLFDKLKNNDSCTIDTFWRWIK